jgi:hypothetical protein
MVDANPALNPFLTRVMRELHARRQPLPTSYRFEQRLLELPYGRGVWTWFVTHGCSWDACTMCDYGKGPEVEIETMVAAVRDALARLPPDVEVLIVTPTGSMLDPAEVPPEARRRIFALMAEQRQARVLIVETRADTVVATVLEELVAAFRGATVVVQMGLESANPWVSRFCVNKGGDTERLVGATQLCRAHGVKPAANVCLGTAFLSPAEALADAVASVRWLHQIGVDQALVFPMHAKPHTVLGELFRLGAYAPPSLWSLIEVLRCLAPAERDATNLSWYRQEAPGAVLASPTTCPSCRLAVLTLLDRYRATRADECLEELSRLDCACKELWRRSLVWPTTPLPQRVAAAYDQLAQRLRLQAAWRRWRDNLLGDLEAQFVPIRPVAPI